MEKLLYIDTKDHCLKSLPYERQNLSLPTIYKTLDCTCIEGGIIDTPYGDICLYCDEEAKVNGTNKDTSVLWINIDKSSSPASIVIGEEILGNVCFFQNDGEGYETSLTDEQEEWLKEHIKNGILFIYN